MLNLWKVFRSISKYNGTREFAKILMSKYKYPNDSPYYTFDNRNFTLKYLVDLALNDTNKMLKISFEKFDEKLMLMENIDVIFKEVFSETAIYLNVFIFKIYDKIFIQVKSVFELNKNTTKIYDNFNNYRQWRFQTMASDNDCFANFIKVKKFNKLKFLNRYKTLMLILIQNLLLHNVDCKKL